MQTVTAILTQNQRGPVGDPSFKTLMEDLVQKHDGLTTDREVSSCNYELEDKRLPPLNRIKEGRCTC